MDCNNVAQDILCQQQQHPVITVMNLFDQLDDYQLLNNMKYS
jgi:hypothetical protein